MSIVNPVIYYVPIRHLATAIVAFRSNYLPAYKAAVIYVPIRHYICRERSTNQLLFMQNKPNFRKAKMSVNPYITTGYEKFIPLAGQKNKPNSNPIKPNSRKAKMNVNSFITKDYRKKDYFTVRINKPNFRNGQNERKRFFTKGL